MPLLEAEANKLSEIQLERGVIEEIIDREALFALLPFLTVNGKSYDYNRENTLSEGEFLDPYDVVPEGAATFTEVNTRLRIMAGDVDLDNFLTSTQSDLNSQLAIQITQKSKAMTRMFKRALVNGNNSVNNKSFDGLKTLIPAGQVLIAGANGAAVTFSMLDELRDQVVLGADFFMMRTPTWRAIKQLLRGMGGNTADTIMIENFGHAVPAIDGLPVIINDFITTDEVMGSNTATTSIYAVKCDESVGFHGIVGGEAAGLKVELIGIVQNKDATRYRLKWYVGTALKSTLSVARLKGITNI